jgi:hypothetical protein
VDDHSFNVSIHLQWREAFLYNIGAQMLPEGDNALEEFQLMYDGAFEDD